MKKRLLIVAAALVVAAATVAAAVGGAARTPPGAKANLDKYRAGADVHGARPGVRREGEGGRQDDLRHPGLEPGPVRLDDRQPHQARSPRWPASR